MLAILAYAHLYFSKTKYIIYVLCGPSLNTYSVVMHVDHYNSIQYAAHEQNDLNS